MKNLNNKAVATGAVIILKAGIIGMSAILVTSMFKTSKEEKEAIKKNKSA